MYPSKPLTDADIATMFAPETIGVLFYLKHGDINTRVRVADWLLQPDHSVVPEREDE